MYILSLTIFHLCKIQQNYLPVAPLINNEVFFKKLLLRFTYLIVLYKSHNTSWLMFASATCRLGSGNMYGIL